MTTVATAAKDWWVKAAMIDDEMVVDLLLRLKRARVESPTVEKSVFIPLRWGLRQRRSRTLRWSGSLPRKDTYSASNMRASPTTPLSWSGGSGSDGSSSPSATVDVFEDTRRQATCSTSAGSRSKTFSQLKDEEKVLWKERQHLKEEIASLQATFKEQTARNQSLKRIKLDLNSDCSKKTVLDGFDIENSDHGKERLRSSVSTVRSSDSCKKTDKTVSSNGGFFVLPDLNMTPSEDDSGTETPYGVSQRERSLYSSPL